jgi:hypothetical protein
MPHALHAIDVLMCVGDADVDYLFLDSFRSCQVNFRPLNNIHIVTSAGRRVRDLLRSGAHAASQGTIAILDDADVLPAALHRLPGWCKQQYIKLHADQICTTKHVACLGADTIIFKPVRYEDLVCGSLPILYYTSHLEEDVHLQYERRRVSHVARILRVHPTRSAMRSDFIMDLMVFHSDWLRDLRMYLASLYGNSPFEFILPMKCDNLVEKNVIGEQTLFAVYVLDVRQEPVPLRDTKSEFFAQVHSSTDFGRFAYDATIVHFVNKAFDRQLIREKFAQCRRSQVDGVRGSSHA